MGIIPPCPNAELARVSGPVSELEAGDDEPAGEFWTGGRAEFDEEEPAVFAADDDVHPAEIAIAAPTTMINSALG